MIKTMGAVAGDEELHLGKTRAHECGRASFYLEVETNH